MIKEFFGRFRERMGSVKMRTLLVLVGAIILLILFIFLTTSKQEHNAAATAAVVPKKIGTIESLPGAGEQNQEYEELQLAENLKKAEEAKKTGGSAVARLINPADENAAKLGFGQEFCEECVYDKEGYDKDGYDARGFDRNGFDRSGYDKDGYDKDGYDRDGFDRNGCNRQGLNREGKPCYDTTTGLNAAGYDKFGYDKDGFDKDGYDKDGYDKNGFDRDGYDRDGYDKDGFDRNGCNRQGLNREGKPCGAAAEALAIAPLPISTAVPGTNQQTQAAYQRLLDDEKKREAQRLADLAEQQRLAQLAEERARQQAFEALLQQQSMSLLATWKPSKQVYVGGMLTSVVPGQEQGAGGAGGGAGGAKPGEEKGPVLYKAGDIIFAVLETSLNSDEPGPVLARIVSGPLNGSKVLGELERQKDKLYLNFRMLSSPNLPESIKFDAVAIDPDTARTVLASDVDHHYLLRYGTLFASSFLAGVGEAVQSGLGSPNLEVVDGVVVGQSVQATSKEQFLVGLGKIGESVSEEIDYFNIPPTVTLDSGSSMGLLILSDLRIEEVTALPASAYTSGTVGPNAPKQPQTQEEAIQKGATPSTPLPAGSTVIDTYTGTGK